MAKGAPAPSPATGRTTGPAATAGAPDPEVRPRRARGASVDVERLTAHLANATQALEAERERRAASELALETERSANRGLRTELGQIRAELELAHAAEAEAAAAAAELEAARRELHDAQLRHENLHAQRERERREAQRRHDELVEEREQTTQAHAAARSALHERSGALESAREALAQEQAETGRLRNRLARTAGPAPGPPSDDTAVPEAADEPRHLPHSGPDLSHRQAPVPRARPLNPSLRHRTYWLGRLLALLVLLIVLAAIWIVLHSTILHH